jgi:oligopeptide transport system substrate-binding protein
MAPRKTWSRRLALAGGAAAATGGYWALRRPGGSHTARIPDAGTLRRGNGAEPQTLDNAMSTGTQDDNIIGDLMMGLMTEDPGGHPVPGMATAWSTAPDGLTWRFTLRDAQWSDGAPVTAEDFVFAWRRLVDPTTGAPYASM